MQPLIKTNALGSIVPALAKTQGRGTHFASPVGEIKSLGHPPEEITSRPPQRVARLSTTILENATVAVKPADLGARALPAKQFMRMGFPCGYGYRAVSGHVVEVYLIREFLDTTDVLNLRIADMVVTNTPAMDIFSKPDRFIPELRTYLLHGKVVQACGSIGPGFSSAGPSITLDLHSVTLEGRP